MQRYKAVQEGEEWQLQWTVDNDMTTQITISINPKYEFVKSTGHHGHDGLRMYILRSAGCTAASFFKSSRKNLAFGFFNWRSGLSSWQASLLLLLVPRILHLQLVLQAHGRRCNLFDGAS